MYIYTTNTYIQIYIICLICTKCTLYLCAHHCSLYKLKPNSFTTINRKRWSCVGVALCWPTSVNISLLQPSNCLNPLFIHRHHHQHLLHRRTIIFITNILNNIISLLQPLRLPRSHIFKAFMTNLDQI